MKKTYKNRLQIQITAYFILLILFVINTVGWLVYFRVSRYFDEELGKKLVGIAIASSDFMDPELLGYLKPGDENGKFYQSLQQTLLKFQRDFSVDRIYIIDKDFRLLVDTQKGTPIGGTNPNLQLNLVELNIALNGKPVYSTLYQGNSGRFYKSAFAPIKTPSGKVVAITGVDASPVFMEVLNQLRRSIFWINLIGLLIALFLGIILARSIVNPIRKLVRAANRISEGNFTKPVVIPSKNEIGFLGSIFNDMQKNIQQKEKSLKQLKQLAEARAESIKNYNDYILESIANGILTIDSEERILVINPEAAKILRLDGDKCAGKSVWEIFSETHPFYSYLAKAVNGTLENNFLEITLNFEESPAIIDIHTSLLFDSKHSAIGTNFVLMDVTQIRELQEKIKEKQRLAQLGEFSAIIAHEIRNPLNSIELFVGLLERQLANHSQHLEITQKIINEIHALNEIVTDFLFFARPSKPRLQVVHLSELFQETLSLTKNEVKKKDIVVSVHLKKNNLFLKADFNQIKRALLNIVLNGIQAMEAKGQLSLSADILTEKNSSKYVEIIISDTGSGIPLNLQEKIFQPFFSTRSQGTGLGLAIAKNIIEAHQGEIFVESQLNFGTTFHIKLPKEAGISNGNNFDR